MLDNTTILLVRHGEKDNPQDADEDGGDPFLNDVGWTRAQRYVDYFKKYRVTRVGDSDSTPFTLTHLVASADSTASYRPHQTVQLVANAHPKAPFETDISNDDYQTLVDKLAGPASDIAGSSYSNADIVICWHHGKILDLARALLKSGGQDNWNPPKANTWPTNKWPADVFCWVLQICYDGKAAVRVDWTRCIDELLMPGDKNHKPPDDKAADED
jgi:hypothetical protein